MYRHLPGGELLELGLKALASGQVDENVLLIAIGAPRLQKHGIVLPRQIVAGDLPEHQLFDLLARKYPREAHSRYNSLVRLLVSLENALDVAG